MSEKIRIGLISKLMRMTPEAIRFYEKKNIIQPERTTDSQYREYTIQDIRKLYECKNLRNINFSIKEVEHIVNEISFDENLAMLNQKKVQIEAQIEEQQRIIDKINQYLAVKERYERFDSPQLIENFNWLFYAYAIDEKLNHSFVTSSVYEQIMDSHNLFSCSTYFEINPVSKKFQIDFGFAIDLQTAKAYQIEVEDSIAKIISQKVIMVLLKTETYIEYSDIEPAIKWCASNGYLTKGEYFGRLIGTFYNFGKEERYYELYIPVVKKDTLALE